MHIERLFLTHLLHEGHLLSLCNPLEILSYIILCWSLPFCKLRHVSPRRRKILVCRLQLSKEKEACHNSLQIQVLLYAFKISITDFELITLRSRREGHQKYHTDENLHVDCGRLQSWKSPDKSRVLYCFDLQRNFSFSISHETKKEVVGQSIFFFLCGQTFNLNFIICLQNKWFWRETEFEWGVYWLMTFLTAFTNIVKNN